MVYMECEPRCTVFESLLQHSRSVTRHYFTFATIHLVGEVNGNLAEIDYFRCFITLMAAVGGVIITERQCGTVPDISAKQDSTAVINIQNILSLTIVSIFVLDISTEYNLSTSQSNSKKITIVSVTVTNLYKNETN